ncbi:oxidoreductase [Pseudonocardia sp. K10HN5]|uniref:Oxidoreductase n=1 Tax=Pseudonocardia acidicola TaxID=2724939 RepID=A0ABX1SBA0_9PSEU|nr:PDR/VanB family oxidoreductase [Pseudonocardia acidicola]NMH97453.1 oxidoreductase [Pseudonocardia acidicola]
MLVQRASWEADGVLALRLVDPGGAALPQWSPGAHVDLVLASGLVRQYSLCGDPADRSCYLVAVRREPAGRGGSAEVHATALVGTTLGVRGPRNRFELVDAPAYLLLAGGIGITPLLPMLVEIRRRGRPCELWYGGRDRASMPFVDRLRRLHPDGVHIVPQDECGLLDVAGLTAAAAPGTAVYCCGPEGLLRAAEQACGELDLHTERFAATAAPAVAAGGAFEVELRRSGTVLAVPPDRTLLDVVRAAGADVLSSCEDGFCGTCEVRVLDGEPEHHDTILSAAERGRGETMMICVGRSRSPRLVLDL